tara:strand:- start:4114 stop:4257 length:144 start_codon:yes stop_codon:yes gene_type:complete
VLIHITLTSANVAVKNPKDLKDMPPLQILVDLFSYFLEVVKGVKDHV